MKILKSKKSTKILTVKFVSLLFILLLAVSGAGCLSQNNENRIDISGSNTVLPLVHALAEAYMKENREIGISLRGGGSGTGIAALASGTSDVAMSSRDIRANEIANAQNNGVEPVEHAIAIDGITIIVHPSNPITSLTMEQLRKIYSGEIRNWNEVGGEDLMIAAIARDSASGTQEYFNSAVMRGTDFRTDLITQVATGAVMQEVAQNRRAIAYIGVAYQNPHIKVIGINVNGTVVMPTEETILSGEYPLSRPVFLYTDKAQRQAVADFIAFILSADGQEIVRDMGFAPVWVSDAVSVYTVADV
jgi:phosphate transport system substrate-binding protein